MSLRKSPTRTPASLAANRANAQKSTGPRTEEGKRRMRLNGLKHGLRCSSFRESLIKSGESTELLDRNFLVLTLYLLPQKRCEVHRIADFVCLLWSVVRWGRRHAVRAATLDRLVKNFATQLELDALVTAAEQVVAKLARRRKTRAANRGLEARKDLVQSPTELDLLRRTGPALLRRLASPELAVKPRSARSRSGKSYEQSRNLTWNQ
jgi:hypothetical protein